MLELIRALRNVQDVTTLGRLAQISEFLGHNGDMMDKEFTNELIRTNRDLRASATTPGADMARTLRGQDPSSQIEHGMCALAGQEYVAHAVEGWGERVIRRGNNSVSWDGVTPITQGLPPLTIVDAYLEVSEAELVEIEEAVTRIEER